MSGLLRRIRGARATAPDPVPGEDAVRPEQGGTAYAHDDPEQGGGHAPVPAGVDLDAYVGERPTTHRRSALRRRLRHLRRVREVLLRDLGGLVFEIHRSGQAGSDRHAELVNGKLARLAAVDAEVRELQEILDDRRPMVLREPGIGGSCPLCGELHGSDARFCWACGTPVAPGAARPVVATAADTLPAIGAPAREGTPTHAWTEPARPLAAPHVDGHGEEIRPETGDAETVEMRQARP